MRSHDNRCRCAKCRHARFNPGPPSHPRHGGFYGHFKADRRAIRAYRLNQVHAEALQENAHRGLLARLKAAIGLG